MKTCATCGAEFEPKLPNKQRFCSTHCRMVARHRRVKQDKPKVGQCLMCERPFTYYASRTQVFCSKACGIRAKGQRTDIMCQLPWRDCGRCGGAIANPRKACHETCRAAVLLAPCPVCGSAMRATRKSCSVRCNQAKKDAIRSARREDVRVQSWDPRPCTECGRVFVPTRTTAVDRNGRVIPGLLPSMEKCSRDCIDAFERRRMQSIKKQREMRIRGIRAERIDWATVGERDGWKCQLCGVSTPKRLRGRRHDRAPEVDHILPLARGGQHVYTNVQLACRSCNRLKRDRPLGQLRLLA